MLKKKSLLSELYQRKKCVSSWVIQRVKKRTRRREMNVVPATKCRCLVELDVTAVWKNEKYVS